MAVDWLQNFASASVFDSRLPRYIAISSSIENLILAGDLLPGDKLPSERALADLLGVSRSTIVSAYGLLSDSGRIHARQGQGTVVSGAVPGHVAASRRRTAMNSPALLRAAEAPAPARRWVDLSLGTAEPEEGWLVPSETARSLALREDAYRPEGLLDLRERIAERYTRRGTPTSPDQIIVCSGAQQALSLIGWQFIGSGDTVVLEDPNYFGAIDLFRAAGANLLGVPVRPGGEHGIDVETTLKHGGIKLAYICPGMHNPTGYRWTQQATDRLARAAHRASSTLIVVDDSLADLQFTHAAPPVFADARNVVHVGSITKSLWSGLRIGWLRAHPDVVQVLRRAKASADVASSTLNAAIACDLIERFDALIAPRLSQLTQKCGVLRAALASALPGWRVHTPEGGLFLWVALPAGNAEALATQAERHCLRLTPGTSMAVAQGSANTMLRLAFTSPEPALHEGVRRLAAAWALHSATRRV